MKMGNEKSIPKGLDIDDKALEITDFWSHHSSSWQVSNPQNLSIFISEPSLHSDASFGKPSPLEKAAKNLMLHRHPSILKFATSWSKGTKFYLATEEVKPLAQVIGAQTTLQICIGLHNLLKALLFLHKNAASSHNNICCSSIYVTSDGHWKLGGLEYLCKISDLNNAYFRKIKTYRCENAISPDEEMLVQNIAEDPSAVDKYAFSVLAEDVLKLKKDDDVPGLASFKEMCKQRLKDASLSSLINHPFFTHEFMKIHEFLTELPLKNDCEKEEFFSSLISQLQNFPEKIVAEQFGKLLLSRMVLIDATAQNKFIPIILKPKASEKDTGLFSPSTFQACLVPQLLQMFCVRDASIRILLLSHLNSFASMFQTDDLKHRILPELLVGVKDTDEHLVAITLRALADLIPILGAATVIGGKRGRLFSDGRPNKPFRSKKNHHVTFSSPIKTVQVDKIPDYLSERPSPDGGEDEEEPNLSFSEEENWSDWENSELGSNNLNQESNEISQVNLVPNDSSLDKQVTQFQQSLKLSKTYTYERKKVNDDINELDIKNSKSIPIEKKDEIDFFADMKPVIQKTTVIEVEEGPKINRFKSNLLPMQSGECIGEEGDGWGNELDNWEIDEK